MNDRQPPKGAGKSAQPDAPGSLPSYWTWKRFFPVAILLGLGVVFFVALFFLVQDYEQKRDRTLLERTAADHRHSVDRRMQSDREALESIQHFFVASETVEEHEFRAFVEGPLRWHPEIESFEWLLRVPAGERLEYERAYGRPVRRRLGADRQPESAPIPSGSGDHFPLHYYAGRPGMRPELGYDYASDDINRVALNAARLATNAGLVATGPFQSLPWATNAPGVTRVRFFIPIYRNATESDATIRAGSELMGVAAMVIRPGELARQARLGRPAENMRVIAFDQARLVFMDPEEHGAPGEPDLTGLLAESHRRMEERLELPGRSWTLFYQPRFPERGLLQWEALAVLVGGLVLTGLLSSYLYTLLGQTAYVENVVTRRTRELASMNVRLQNEIGERERGERALRNSEALYHSLVDTLPMNILRKNLQGEITFGNRRYCETMGQPLERILGKTDFDLFPAKLAEKYVSDDQAVILGRKVFEDVEEHRRLDGSFVYMHVLKAPVTDALGKVVGTQVIFWDVTEKKRAEEALKRTLEDLARSNRDLEQFAYVASHDLQEPLRMVASYTELLAKRYDQHLDGEAREFIRFIVDGAVRMQLLIEDLLTYSRLDTKGVPLEPTPSDLALRDAMSNLRVTIEESGAQVTHDPLPLVVGDHFQLVQLFQNLLSNAIKFRAKAPPKIHVSAQRKGQEWIVSVHDNGQGIDPQYAERIFVIFQRLHSREKYPGTGIGLAICKKIVERHGGRIWVESKPGEGAKFYFMLRGARGSSTGA